MREVKCIKRLITISTLVVVSLLLLPSLLPYLHTVRAEDYDAEENIYVVGDLPEVSVGKDTIIKLVFEDHAGFNYTLLVEKFSWPIVHLWWPILFGYLMGGGKKGLEEFQRYVCLHSIEFQAYIDGNLSGWHAIVEPSLITGSTSGHKANLTLKVRVDGPTTYPMADVVIKVIRKGANGEILGISRHKISLKAEHIYLLDVKPLKSVIEALPGSTVTIPVELTNRGNYVETYRIFIRGKGIASLSGSQFITIDPGETVKTSIQVYTPFSFFDLGTPRKIEIEVYPVESPNNVFTAGVSIITRGLALHSIPILILIVIIVIFLIKLLVQAIKVRGGDGGETVKEIFKKMFSKRGGSEKASAKDIREAEFASTQDREKMPKTRDLRKLIAKVKKEEKKQKRKFEKLG